MGLQAFGYPNTCRPVLCLCSSNSIFPQADCFGCNPAAVLILCSIMLSCGIRTGRLWQSLILQKWKDVFAWIPVETLVYENQEEYYKILRLADKVGDSTDFVEFMLGMIRNALKEISETHDKTDVGINVGINVVTNEEKIIALLRQDGNMSANMLSVSVGVTERQIQRILAKLKAEGKIIRHGANKNGYWEVIE